VPPRVLVWTEQHAVGGNDRFLADLLAGLDRSQWDVRVAGVPNATWDAWLAERVPWAIPKLDVAVATLGNSPLNRLRRANSSAGPAPELSKGEGATAVSASVAALRWRQAAWNLMRLTRLLRGARPDVLFVNNGGWPGAETCRWIPLAARRAGVSRVVQFVHNMPSAPHWPPRVERAIDRRVDAVVDAWVTGAHRASDALRAAGMTGVHTVHYGIPPAPLAEPATDLGYDDGALNVAVVAAFEERKGHAVLLDAARRLGDRARFALAGDGEALERTRAAAADVPTVRLLGRRSDVPAILEASDALVLPSLANECLPYAILEAMAAGLPVVGTDVAGIPEEIADGETGYVVPPGDAAALAAAIGRLADDPTRARALGEAGRRRAAQRFAVDRMVDAMTALWR
jgi:glycosyltransferase involved in cell wall biosynthesis